MLKILIFAVLIFSVKASCPKEAFEWQTNCFFFNNVSTGFADAESNCASLFGGHLSSIHDGFTNALLAQKGQIYFHESTVTDFWIGLTNLMFPGNWTWMDGTNLDFKEWASGEPQNATANCAVLSVADGVWRIDDCFKLKPYVCRVDKNFFDATSTTAARPITTYSQDFNCSKDFLYFAPTHSCYGYGQRWEGKASWTIQEQYCEDQGGHLASIHSYEELQLLTTFASLASSPVWIGATSNDGGKTWQWSDKTPWDYNPWWPGYPSSISGCGAIDYNGMYDINCSTSYAAVCKITIFQ